MISIDEDGTGYLLVDGEVQDLVEPFEPTDLTVGFSDSIGKSFNTTVWPNKELGIWNSVGRRLNQITDAPTATTDSPTSSLSPTSAPTFSPHPVDPEFQVN